MERTLESHLASEALRNRVAELEEERGWLKAELARQETGIEHIRGIFQRSAARARAAMETPMLPGDPERQMEWEELEEIVAELAGQAQSARSRADALQEICAQQQLGRRFMELAAAQKGWSEAMFGPADGPAGSLAHLDEEIDEILEHPEDDHEYADAQLLLLDAWWRRGKTFAEFVEACWEKFNIVLDREWQEPDENGVRRHVRKEDE